MPIQSFKTFEEIIMYLSILRYIFKSRTKKGQYDLNKKAEPFFKNIMNIVYDWNLIDLNEIQSNYPAIDLGDSQNKVCVQVTAENGSSKISKTVDKFVEKSLYKSYSRLILLIITDKKNYTVQFDTGGHFSFSKTSDIKDIDDLLTDIEKLSLEKLTELHQFLKAELSTIIEATAEPSSLLAKAEKKIHLPPKDGGKLFTHLEYEDEEKKKGISDLKKFYKCLTDLPKNTREYLHFIVMNGTKASVWGNNRITIQPRKLESLLKLSTQTSNEEFRILEESGIASYDDSDVPPFIEVSFFMDTGVELFSALKEYSKSEAELLKIIVDCDFTKLDAAG